MQRAKYKMIIKLIKTLLIIYHITIIQLLFKQLRSESCDKVKFLMWQRMISSQQKCNILM